MSNQSTQLRRLIEQTGPLLLPGVYDCLTAKIVQAAGFSAAFLGDGAVSVSRLGLPDFGLVSLMEVIDRAREICSSVSIPLLVDVGTGYGNALNVRRTVRQVEDAGAGGVFFEDQTWPKKCGHIPGRSLIPQAEMVNKVRAAADARSTPNFVIVARTDARAIEGLDAAIQRLRAYGEAGADVVFIDALESLNDLQRTAREVPYPLMANMLEGGRTPYLSAVELGAIGYKVVIWPETLMYAAFAAMMEVAKELKANGTTSQSSREKMTDFGRLSEFLGLQDLYSLERRYASEG